MKRFTGLMLTLALVASSLGFGSVSASAATEVVPVYLDNKAVTFAANDAQPQIISDRTYVPVRATCDALGLSIDWNTKTETLTFTRDGVTIAHTMRSKVVFVNGTEVDFDTPSINRNNRTLMPIRMLAESIGATVTWDNSTRSVHITTAQTVSDTSASSTATVNSITLGASTVNSGDKVTITAVASSDTDKVSFRNIATGEVLEEVSEYSVNSDNTRTFEASYKFVNDTSSEQSIVIKALPATASGEFLSADENAKTTSIIVKAASSSSSSSSDDDDDDTNKIEVNSDYIDKVSVKSQTVSLNNYATLTVKTTTKVSKVKVTNDFDADDVIETDYDSDDDQREFTIKVKMTEKGTKTLKIYPYIKGDGYDSEYASVKIKVSSSSSDDDDDDDNIKIKSLDVSNDYVYKDMDAHIYITTSTNVKKIYIKDEDGETVASTGFYSSKGTSEIKWSIDLTANSVGKQTYTVYAYDSDDNYAKDTFKLTCKSWSKYDVLVLDVVQKTNDIVEGEDAKFEIICTSGTSYATITRGTSTEVGRSSSGSGSGSTKKFYVTFEMGNVDNSYYAHACSDSGSGNDYLITFDGDVYEEIAVKNIDVEKTSVKEDEDVEVSALTSGSAVKVWIEDSRGNRVSKIYKTPSDEDGSDLVWDMTFSPTETGKNTYTVVAQDDNSKKETKDFKVTVKSS